MSNITKVLFEGIPTGPLNNYQVIYADPPWQYSDKSKNRGGAERHYDTMSIDDLCELNVKALAADDSLLFMWVTFPMLEDAFRVMRAWGFEYKTCGFTWVKTNKDDSVYMGMGHYTRSNSELCLIGKRGKGVKRLNAGIRNTQLHRREEHSKKPDQFRKDIEALHGDVPRIELFARDCFDGWDAWGNELDGLL